MSEFEETKELAKLISDKQLELAQTIVREFAPLIKAMDDEQKQDLGELAKAKFIEAMTRHKRTETQEEVISEDALDFASKVKVRR